MTRGAPKSYRSGPRDLDGEHIWTEAVPLAKLVAVLALVPVAFAVTFGTFPRILMLVAQFILAVGTGIVLLYIVARGIQLAEE